MCHHLLLFRQPLESHELPGSGGSLEVGVHRSRPGPDGGRDGAQRHTDVGAVGGRQPGGRRQARAGRARPGLQRAGFAGGVVEHRPLRAVAAGRRLGHARIDGGVGEGQDAGRIQRDVDDGIDLRQVGLGDLVAPRDQDVGHSFSAPGSLKRAAFTTVRIMSSVNATTRRAAQKLSSSRAARKAPGRVRGRHDSGSKSLPSKMPMEGCFS